MDEDLGLAGGLREWRRLENLAVGRPRMFFSKPRGRYEEETPLAYALDDTIWGQGARGGA